MKSTIVFRSKERISRFYLQRPAVFVSSYCSLFLSWYLLPTIILKPLSTGSYILFSKQIELYIHLLLVWTKEKNFLSYWFNFLFWILDLFTSILPLFGLAHSLPFSLLLFLSDLCPWYKSCCGSTWNLKTCLEVNLKNLLAQKMILFTKKYFLLFGVQTNKI